MACNRIRRTHRFCCHWIFLFVLLSTAVVQTQGNALRDRWSLPDAPVSFEFADDETVGGLDFEFVYPVSRDVATLDNIDVNLYDKGCKYNDGEPNVEIVQGFSGKIVFPDDVTESTAATVMTSLELTLGYGGVNVGSLLRAYPTLWDEEESRITFCVRFSLVTEDIEVNFLETVVTLDVTLVGVGYQIEKASATPKEKIESISRVNYNVKAYLCDGRYRPLREIDQVQNLYQTCVGWDIETETTITEDSVYEQDFSEYQLTEREKITYPQGSVVRVCIRPDDTVLGQVHMRTIDQMVFEGTVTPDASRSIYPVPPTTYMEKGIFGQVAVEDGSTDVSSGMSAMSCDTNRLEGHNDVVVCAVDTLLVASFYWRGPGVPGKVIAYGKASLSFGPHESVSRSRSRDLQPSHHSMVRKIQPIFLPPPLPERSLQNNIPERSLQSNVPLDQYWNMTRPKVNYTEEGGGFDFDMEYILSDAMAKDMIRLEVWKKDCQQIGEEPEMEYSAVSEASTDLLEITSTDAYETGDGSGTQAIVVSARWRRDENGFATDLMKSEYYKENSDGTLIQISLCMRCQLHTKASSGSIEVNFLETPVIINIDLAAAMTYSMSFTLTSGMDDCIDDLAAMSAGGEGIDDLYLDGVYWAPSYQDPQMPLGPAIYGTASERISANKKGSNAWAQFYSKRSSGPSKHRIGRTSWAITSGFFIFCVLSVI